MSGCLREQTLLLLYEGEGTSAHRAHLEACTACATRYQRLVHDLEVIGQVLREAPPLRQAQDRPPKPIPHRSHPLRIRWMPMAATLAVTLALVWGGIWVWSPAPPGLPEEARNEDVVLFLEEVSTALFSTVDAEAAEIPAPVSNSDYLQTALEGEGSCEWQEPFFTPECEDNSFPLLFGGL